MVSFINKSINNYFLYLKNIVWIYYFKENWNLIFKEYLKGNVLFFIVILYLNLEIILGNF